MDPKVKVFKSRTNQHKPPKRQGKGRGCSLLPSVTPVSRAPFIWLKHHNVFWVSTPIPESDIRRFFRLDEFPIVLKRPRRKEIHSVIYAFLIGDLHTRYHLLTGRP